VARQESHSKGLIFDTGCRRSAQNCRSSRAVRYIMCDETKTQLGMGNDVSAPARIFSFRGMTARRDGARASRDGEGRGDGYRSFVSAGTPSAFNQTLCPAPGQRPASPSLDRLPGRGGASFCEGGSGGRGSGSADRWVSLRAKCEPGKVDRPSKSRYSRPAADRETNTTSSALAGFPGIRRTVPGTLEGFPLSWVTVGSCLPCPEPRLESILVLPLSFCFDDREILAHGSG
jgi:hypothetical protein